MIAIKKMVSVASAAVLLGLGSAVNAAQLELALVLDASGSINSTEWNTQRQGYATALGTVLPTNGTVSISVTTFGSSAAVARPMTLIDSALALTSLTTFFTTLSQSGVGSSTCITCGISTAYSTFSAAPDTRRVIDVSTDGVFSGTNPNGSPNTVGTSQWAVDGGVNGGGIVDTVNTIGIGTGTVPNFFYGLNAFGLVVTNFDQFEAGLRNKLEREVIGSVIPVPGALPLMVSGLLAFGYISRRRKV